MGILELFIVIILIFLVAFFFAKKNSQLREEASLNKNCGVGLKHLLSQYYTHLDTAVKYGFKNFAESKGRTWRSEFWWWMLFSACVNMGISFISIHLGAYIISSICAMVFVLPNFSMAIRRLHDTGRSGWWYAPVLVPSSIFLICGPYGYGVHDSGGSILYVIMLIGSVINLIWWCKPGDEDGNKYGPNPNAVSNSSSLRRISIREEDVNHGAMSSPKDGYDSDDDKPRYIKID